MLRSCWKAKEGSSATDSVTDVTDVTDVSPMEVGRRKMEEKSLNFFQLSIPDSQFPITDSQLPVTDYEEGRRSVKDLTDERRKKNH